MFPGALAVSLRFDEQARVSVVVVWGREEEPAFGRAELLLVDWLVGVPIVALLVVGHYSPPSWWMESEELSGRWRASSEAAV